MRKRLSDGHVDAPLLIYVGRIGAEKKLHRLKKGIRILCDFFILSNYLSTPSILNCIFPINSLNIFKLLFYTYFFLVLDSNPGARLAFIGKGPMDDEMKKLFSGYPVHFAGQLVGKLHII